MLATFAGKAWASATEEEEAQVEEPKRIVSLLPSLTEVVVAVAENDELVGVSDHCVVGQGKEPARVGGLWPDTEKILSLRPDLVIADASQEERLQKVRAAGVRVETVPATLASTIEERLETAERTGALLDRPEAGRCFANKVRTRIEEVEEAVADRERPTIAYIARWNPLSIAGGDYVEHDVMRYAGGENLGGELPSSSFRIGEEDLDELDPEVLLVPVEEDVERVMERWPELQAVREGQVRVLDLRHHPDEPRDHWQSMAEDVERLAEMLHPEVVPAQMNEE